MGHGQQNDESLQIHKSHHLAFLLAVSEGSRKQLNGGGTLQTIPPVSGQLKGHMVTRQQSGFAGWIFFTKR